MPNTTIEIPWVTEGSVEHAYGRCMQAQRAKDDNFANTGMRAARRRDPKLLLALEKGSEIIDRIAERQQGRTRRDASVSLGERTEFTEAQLWKKAYEFADKGEPLQQLCWIYGAAAVLAGFQA